MTTLTRTRSAPAPFSAPYRGPAAHWWTTRTRRSKLGYTTLLALLGAALAAQVGFPPLAGVATGLTLAALAAAAITSPSILATTAILTGAAIFVWLPTSVATTGTPNAYITYALAAATTTWVATKWCRGRPWLTVLLTQAALLIPGLPLFLAIPELGPAAPLLASATVLALRAGVVRRLSTRARYTWHVLQARRRHLPADPIAAPTPPTVRHGNPRKSLAAAEKTTSRHLQHLPRTWAVWNNVTIGKNGPVAQHIAIGPSGVYLIATNITRRGITAAVDPDRGEPMEDVSLGATGQMLLTQREHLAHLLGVNTSAIMPVVVVYGPGVDEWLQATDEDGARPGVRYLTVTPGPLQHHKPITLTWATATALVHEMNIGLPVLGGATLWGARTRAEKHLTPARS